MAPDPYLSHSNSTEPARTKKKRQHIDEEMVSHQQNNISLVWTCVPGKLQK